MSYIVIFIDFEGILSMLCGTYLIQVTQMDLAQYQSHP